MDQLSKYGDHAAVLGAAQGLGKDFAIELAKAKKNLLLFDVLENELEITSRELRSTFNVDIEFHVLDLAVEENWDSVIKIIIEMKPGMVVFNAAHGSVQTFHNSAIDSLDRELQLNIRMTIYVLHGLIRHNLAADRSLGIVLMSSLSAIYGTKYVVTYAATKAFLKNMAEGLYHELEHSRIDILACCAGLIDTPGLRSSNPNLNIIGTNPMKPQQVAKEALHHLGKKAVHIPGRSNRLSYFVLTRLLSRAKALKFVNSMMSKIYDKSILGSKL